MRARTKVLCSWLHSPRVLLCNTQPFSCLAGAACAEQRFPCLSSAAFLLPAASDGGSDSSSGTGYLSSSGSSYWLYSEEEDEGEGEGGEMSMRALLGALADGASCGFWTEDRLHLFQVGGRRDGAAARCRLAQPASWHAVQP